MDVLQAAAQRRSIRRFIQKPIAHEALASMAEAARLAPTGMNNQPLKFIVLSNPEALPQVFAHTYWARRIPDGSAGPDTSTQPAAYIAILVDMDIATNADTDAGAAGMSILLTAESLGISSCWLGSIDRKEILSILHADPTRYTVHSLIALGYAASKSRPVFMENGKTAYYLEAPDSLCVPKRRAEDAICFIE